MYLELGIIVAASMQMRKSNLSIYSALVANLLIAVIKFIAGTVSNSSAMIAEGIHSIVDTANELLVLFGLHQSQRPADRKRPFGYGRELYFWSFIVSMLIFGLGGGISIYQGIVHIINPEKLGDPFWNYIVLATSILFEGTSLLIAARAFNKIAGHHTWWQTVKDSKDPSDFLVLFEDGAAVLGLLIVACCVWLGHRYQINYLDGVASLLVGIILVAVSLVLARESRSLLMGEGIAIATRQRIIAIVEADPSTEKTITLFSIYMGADEILLIMDIQFKAELKTPGIHHAIDRLKEDIQKEYPRIKYVVIQPEFKS
ncbi:MAG: cation diffusion facilitator family transporter [Ferruginibacter sp.]